MLYIIKVDDYLTIIYIFKLFLWDLNIESEDIKIHTLILKNKKIIYIKKIVC